MFCNLANQALRTIQSKDSHQNSKASNFYSPLQPEQQSLQLILLNLHIQHLITICQTLGDDIIQDRDDVALVVGHCAP